MGEMADMALQGIVDMEGLRDEYVEGFTSNGDAHDLGLIDPMGVEAEGMQSAWDRHPIRTAENIDRELAVLENMFDLLSRS